MCVCVCVCVCGVCVCVCVCVCDCYYTSCHSFYFVVIQMRLNFTAHLQMFLGPVFLGDKALASQGTFGMHLCTSVLMQICHGFPF